MKKSLLNFKISPKGIFIFLVLLIAVAWLVSYLSPYIAPKNPGPIHLWAEKIYTGGLIVLFVWLGIATMAVPILAGGLFVIAASLAWHLYRKFRS